MQKTLFNVKEPVKKEGLSKKDGSFKNILQAKRTGNWKKVTDTDFTRYFICRHNQLLEKRIVFNFFNSVTVFREGFRLRYNIPKEEMCYYINNILDVYLKDSQKWDCLSFGMISNNISLMDRLIAKVDERRIANNNEELKVSDELREKYKNKEVF